jgi:hypothetical protein
MNDQVKLDEITPALSAKEAENMITTNLPPIDHHGETVERLAGTLFACGCPTIGNSWEPSLGRTVAARCFQGPW